MRNNLSSIVLAVLGVSSLAVAVPMSVARANQQAEKTTRSPFTPATAPTQQFGAPSPGQQLPPEGAPPIAPVPGMQMGGPMPGPMGGNTTMVADEGNLYILMGNRLLKVSKSDLRVVREGQLPMGPPRRMEPGREFPEPAPGGRGGGQGGGGK